jgi:hypothetical protein
MKNKILVLVAVITGTVYLSAQNLNDSLSSKRPKVSILGTFHFGATNDFASIQLLDLFSDKRQNEIDALVEKIKAYNPTKIMVEWEPSAKEALDKEFIDYLQGKFNLNGKRNEIYQLGFRIAKATGITELYPIDFPLNLGDEDVETFLSNHPDYLASFKRILTEVGNFAINESKILEQSTILEYFARLNTKDMDDKNRNFYLDDILGISVDEKTPITDYVGNWYLRNLYISKRIEKYTKPNDRILVIIGSGHRAILKELFKGRRTIDYVEIANYL